MELLDILDEFGNYTGKIEERKVVHDKGLWHIHVGVWIMNEKGELLFQQRSMEKKINPGKWTWTGGHVDSGETPLEAIQREVLEEIGVKIPLENFKLIKTTKEEIYIPKYDVINRHFIYSYFAKVNYKLEDYSMQKEEVIDLKDDASETNIISETNVRSGEFTVKQDRYLFNDNKNPFYSNNYNPNFNINGSLYNKATLERVPIDLTQIQEFTNNAKYDIQNIYNQSLINQLSSDNTNGKYVKQIDGNSVRYSDEERFFMLLKDNDPFLHYKITEKIKYFDPAFHSITPEGFNARLTFLHQCTRQGATISESDNRNDSTATNLAFGRPPVCVLRIGDQYNTKIIIDSMTIDFGDMQWDLNAEGIGVQQMLANVTLSFKFLGGSDLAGAISRLQNALSFNYYANTGVYDNRADMIEKSDDGTIRMKCFK